jgi:hypothetical protein
MSLQLCFPCGLFPSGFPTNILHTFLLFPIHATCPAHLILFHFVHYNFSSIWWMQKSHHWLIYYGEIHTVIPNNLIYRWT